MQCRRYTHSIWICLKVYILHILHLPFTWNLPNLFLNNYILPDNTDTPIANWYMCNVIWVFFMPSLEHVDKNISMVAGRQPLTQCFYQLPWDMCCKIEFCHNLVINELGAYICHGAFWGDRKFWIHHHLNVLITNRFFVTVYWEWNLIRFNHWKRGPIPKGISPNISLKSEHRFTLQ